LYSVGRRDSKTFVRRQLGFAGIHLIDRFRKPNFLKNFQSKIQLAKCLKYIKCFKALETCLRKTYSGSANFLSKMPTQRHAPRQLSYPHFWKILERTEIQNCSELLLMVNLVVPCISFYASLRKKSFFCRLYLVTTHRSFRILLLSALFAAGVQDEINRKRSTVIYTLNPDWRCLPLDFGSPCWQSEEGECYLPPQSCLAIYASVGFRFSNPKKEKIFLCSVPDFGDKISLTR